MKRTLVFHYHTAVFGIPLIILGFLVFLMRSPFLPGNDALGMGVVIDLLVTVPLVYCLLIRKTAIPITSVVPVIIVGLLLGTLFLPEEHQEYLSFFKSWALPVIELSVMVYIVVKVIASIRGFNRYKRQTSDFYTVLKKVCTDILPARLAVLMATEIAVIYYGFIQWNSRDLRENEFSYHKKSGTPSLLGVFIFMIGIETFAIHLLVERWNVFLAWVLTALSVYTIVQVFGFAKSLSQRPVVFGADNLMLRYGIMRETVIPYGDIESVDLSRKSLEKDRLTRKMALFHELESHNVVIQLKKENILTGLYGSKKKYKKIALHIDQPQDFKEKLRVRIG